MAVRTDEEFAVGLKADDQFTPVVKGAGDAAEASTKSIGDLAGAVVGLNQAIELAMKGWHLVKETVGEALAVYGDAVKADKRLSVALAANGQLTRESLGAWKDYAETIQHNSEVDAISVRQMIARAKAMGLSDAATKKIIQTSVDLGGVLEGDVNSRFQALAGTLTGIIPRGLAIADKRIKGLGEEALKHGKAIDLLGERYKGFGKNLATAGEQLANAKHHFEEVIGETISKAFDLSGSKKRMTEVFEHLTDLIKEAQPTILAIATDIRTFFDAIKTGLGQINWGEIFSKMQMVAVVLGTLAVINLAPLLAGLVTAAASMALVAAEFLASGAVIVGVIAALDIIFRNLDKLPQVATMFGAVFLRVLNEVEIALTELFLMLFSKAAQLIGDLGNALPKLAPALIPVVEGLGKATELIGEQLNDAKARADDLAEFAGQTAVGLDLGLTGALMKAGKKFFGMFDENIDAAKKKAAEVGNAMIPNSPPGGAFETGPLGDNAKAVEELMKKTMEARKALDQMGMSEAELVDANLKTQLDEIDALEEKLKIEGQLDALAKAKLGAARDVAKAKAGTEKEAIGDKRLKEIGAAVVAGFRDGAEFLKSVFSGALVESLASGLETIRDMPAALLKAFDHLDQVAKTFLQAFPAAVQTLVAKMPEIVDRFVAAMPAITDAIVAALPAIAKAIAEAAPRIVRALAAAAPEIIQAFAAGIVILIGAIPDIVDGIMDNMPKIIQALMEAIPDIVAALAAAAPAFVENLMEHMDEIAAALTEGMVVSFILLPVTFTEYLLNGGAERIAGALARGFIRAVVGIFNGFMNGLKKIFGLKIKVPNPLKDLPAGIEKAADKLKAAFDKSKLFQVSDLVEAAKGGAEAAAKQLEDLIAEAMNAGKSIWDAFIDALKAGWEWLKKLGGKIWEGLKEFVGEIWAFFKELGKQVWLGLKEIGEEIWAFFSDLGTRIWSGFSTAVEDIGAWFLEMGGKIWSGFSTFVDDPAAWFGERGTEIWNGLVEAIPASKDKILAVGKDMWDGAMARIKDWPNTIAQVGKDMWDGVMGRIKDWPNTIAQVGKDMWDGAMARIKDWPNTLAKVGKDIWDGTMARIKDWPDTLAGVGSQMADGFFKALSDAWGWLSDFFSSLLPGGGGGGDGGVLGTGIGFAGGVVRATTRVAGGALRGLQNVDFSPQGADRVPLLGQGGEMMIRKSAVDKNLGLLSTINSGGSPGLGGGAGGVTIERLEINVRSDVEADIVRTKIWPEIERQLKRKSQDGGFVIASSGVRT